MTNKARIFICIFLAILLITLIILIVLTICIGKKIQVIIPDGTLEGLLMKDFDGGTFYSFRRIPYAQPPIGDRRFRNPVRNAPWNGVLDATKEMPKCLQPNKNVTAEIGTEDCLYLNVFTPQFGGDLLRPVMVYIHGGSLIEGSGAVYGPEYLITENLVLVMINYRLGIYGFMSLLDSSDGENSIANLGFKDQVLALQWVQQNILFFGGDPDQVTISGHSAGGISVHLHILSPLSINLFHRAIVMSGIATMPKICTKRNTVFQIAEVLNIDTKNQSKLMQNLRNVSSTSLFHAAKTIDWFISELNKLGGPGIVIEDKTPDSFISEYPMQIINHGNYKNIPLMMGNANKEGLIYLSSSQNSPDYIDANIPYYFTDRETVKKNITRFYNLYENNTENRISFYSDIWFRFPMFRAINMHTQRKSLLYYYEFGSDTKLNHEKIHRKLENYTGACHGDELGYIFKYTPEEDIVYGSLEEKMMRLMVKLWGNFIKSGKPNNKWKLFKSNEFNFANITSKGIQYGLFKDNRFLFLRDIYKKYNYGLC